LVKADRGTRGDREKADESGGTAMLKKDRVRIEGIVSETNWGTNVKGAEFSKEMRNWGTRIQPGKSRAEGLQDKKREEGQKLDLKKIELKEVGKGKFELRKGGG